MLAGSPVGHDARGLIPAQGVDTKGVTVVNDSPDDLEPAWEADPAGVFFSDRFNVHPNVMAEYGAFDISVVSDLPVFIDPFLLFNSDEPEYLALHDQILEYLRFLRDQAGHQLTPGLIKSWYTFSEVKQNWLGPRSVAVLTRRTKRTHRARLPRVISDHPQTRNRRSQSHDT